MLKKSLDNPEPLWYNTNMDKHDIHHFLNRLTEEELIAILEAARIGLTQQSTVETLLQRVSLSDPDVNLLQHKIHMFLTKFFKTGTIEP